MIELTEGAATIEEQFESFQAAIEGLFTDLDETDRRTLVRVFSALEAKIAKLREAGSGPS